MHIMYRRNKYIELNIYVHLDTCAHIHAHISITIRRKPTHWQAGLQLFDSLCQDLGGFLHSSRKSESNRVGLGFRVYAAFSQWP